MHRFFFLLFCFLAHTAVAQQRFQFTQQKMGAPFSIIFYASDSTTAFNLARTSFALIDTMNQAFSDYIDSSELNRLSRRSGTGEWFPLSPLLYDMLLRSRNAYLQSKGAFDITIGPLSHLWRKARRAKSFPEAGEVEAARKKVGFQHLELDTTYRRARLLVPAMQLDLGGIAQGYVAQKVLDYLTQQGIRSALTNASGDVVCTAPPPGKKGWTVGINQPGSTTDLLPETIEISNCAITTSGDLYQYIEYGGKRYSHIVDPRTGYGEQSQRNVTVMAADGTTADWLATACCILPLRQSKKLVRKTGAHLLVTLLKNGKVNYYMSRGMKKRLRS